MSDPQPQETCEASSKLTDGKVVCDNLHESIPRL